MFEKVLYVENLNEENPLYICIWCFLIKYGHYKLFPLIFTACPVILNVCVSPGMNN